MALGKYGIKRPRLVSFVRAANREGREEKEKREKKRKKKKMEEIKQAKVWNFGFCMETELKYGFMEF